MGKERGTRFAPPSSKIPLDDSSIIYTARWKGAYAEKTLQLSLSVYGAKLRRDNACGLRLKGAGNLGAAVLFNGRHRKSLVPPTFLIPLLVGYPRTIRKRVGLRD